MLNVKDFRFDQQTLRAIGRVGVLLGGDSAEREVSLKSGTAIADALNSAGLDVVKIDTAKDAIGLIQQAAIDVAFIALHGPGGEDGRMQALLDFMGIPYTGSGVQASAIAMDKWRTKQIWRGESLSTPDYRIVNADSDLATILAELGGKVMVKPSHEGSSIGMSRVESLAEFKVALQTALSLDATVIVERLIEGAEYTVAILGDEVLPPIKLEAANRFYDYDAKYISNATRYICPCGLNETKEAELKALAMAGFKAIGCKGWGRVDVMADGAGNFYMLEVNTVPGMTDHSLVPMAAKQAGYSFESLVCNILQDAIHA
ncbi:D-alanine--D-alanine ligase [Simiduia agarivorans]|uniref:D-alanine--D-alanine ligase n=1 Tax=Simiduia agarivorans (strain DSM 21679 / JCM 13881 / BCRC 17597 / SA1) TaxID=1117647 RepID=K4L3E1_SIMAS|nr:D-alanine--D-alanine ligase [Simiduia agarivorans]AFV00693.1 D-alanine--D-alanine ligase [Simiduia agarivorans SA1 = DSM 21679]